MTGNKPIIGLTGGPGAGKTIVARHFGALGCAVIDADQLNHEILTRRDVVRQIAGWWGPQVLAGDGQVDRERLGQVVFGDPEALERLTNLVHPLVFERQRQLLQAHQGNPEVKAIVLDAPLLCEVGQDEWCDAVVFVEADEAVRRERLRRTRGWEREKLRKIENLQWPLEHKASRADYIVRNNSDNAAVADQVADILARVLPAE